MMTLRPSTAWRRCGALAALGALAPALVSAQATIARTPQAARSAPAAPTVPPAAAVPLGGPIGGPGGAVDTLLTTMRHAYVTCPSRIATVALEYQRQAAHGARPDSAAAETAQRQCTDSAAARADSLFRVARRAPISSPVLALLKELYAFWRANLPELQPKTSEEVTTDRGRYRARTDAVLHTYVEKEERLKVEL